MHFFGRGDLPSLKYLLVEAWDWDSVALSAFFTAMTISGISLDLCPSLSSLAYGYGHGVDVFSFYSSLAMMAMAASRMYPKSPCRFLSLRLFARSTGHPDFHKSRVRFQESIAESIQTLADRGLDVAFIDIYQERVLVAQYRP